jgi:hypothetical protein
VLGHPLGGVFLLVPFVGCENAVYCGLAAAGSARGAPALLGFQRGKVVALNLHVFDDPLHGDHANGVVLE